MNLPTKLYIINSKAMTVIELYGILDPITRDWTDGVLSNIFREINRPTEKKERRYGVLYFSNISRNVNTATRISYCDFSCKQLISVSYYVPPRIDIFVPI